jgi:LysR family glycine cleavage system transcriptional activator
LSRLPPSATPSPTPAASGPVIRRRLPPLNSLRAFEVAARHLQVSRAAEELGVTTGAITHHIQALERYIGKPLFRRTSRGLLLTDSAQIALPALMEAFDRLGEAANQLARPAAGRRVTVSAAPSFAAKWLVPRLGRFTARYPEIDVWLSTGMELVDFSAGEIDLAIRYGPGHYAGLEVVPLMSETVTLVASPDLLKQKPLVRGEDLSNHVLLHDGSLDTDESCPDWPMWLAARGLRDIDSSRGPRFNQSSLVIEAAVAGRGIALAKGVLARADVEAGRLVAPLDRSSKTVNHAYFLVYPKHKGRLPHTLAFIDWIRDEARSHEGANLTRA